MIHLTYRELAGLCVVLLLIGGSIAVYGIRFVEWTQRRRDRVDQEWAETPTSVPTQRGKSQVHVQIVADTSGFMEAMERAADTPTQRELRRAQARADAIRDARRRERGGYIPPLSTSDAGPVHLGEAGWLHHDPPPEGMEDRIVERLRDLGDDLRADTSDPSTETNEGNHDGR